MEDRQVGRRGWLNICDWEFMLKLTENTDLSSMGHVIKTTWGSGYRKCYLFLGTTPVLWPHGEMRMSPAEVLGPPVVFWY